MRGDGDEAGIWARLSEKQRACLDLIVERKTSKQIARILEISKPTVDQRITAARTILGAANRDEAAIYYARLKAIYDRIIYDPAQLPPAPLLVPSDFPDGDPTNVMTLGDARSLGFEAEERARGGAPLSRDIWRRDHSARGRILIMVAMLAVLLVILLAGLAIAQTLTQLISG